MHGLKFETTNQIHSRSKIAPNMGARIEITQKVLSYPSTCRTLMVRGLQRKEGTMPQQSKFFYARIQGDRALFTNPITKGGGEKYSYPIPTKQALEGIVDNVYRKPTFTNVVDEVKIIKPIQTEVHGSRALLSNYKADLNYISYLSNVEYLIKFHFEWNMTRGDLAEDRKLIKHEEIMERSLELGGRRDSFLGTRECVGYIETISQDEYDNAETYFDNETIDFGIMFHSYSYPKNKSMPLVAHYTNTIMKNGTVTFKSKNDCEISNKIDGFKYREPNTKFKPVDQEYKIYKSWGR